MSGLPQFNVPPIDPKTGQWNRQWLLLLQHLWERAGGTSDTTDAEASAMTRTHRERKPDEAAPRRHTAPRLVLTKESYKPLTLIRLYTGLTADIPAGWQLADGTNGTPNLCDKFVIGSGNLYGTGTAGGSTTIAANNLPTHTHPYNDLNTTYTASTTSIQPGTGTAVSVVTGIFGASSDTPRTSGSNTTTATPYLPPYYAVAYIINTLTVTTVTDAKLR
jgi:hypothetical protein